MLGQYRLILAQRAHSREGLVLKRHSKFIGLHDGIPAAGALFGCVRFDEGAARLAEWNGFQTSAAQALCRCKPSVVGSYLNETEEVSFLS
jgi:hypothetical protein